MSGESNVVALTGRDMTAARIRESGVLLEYPRYVGGPERHDVVYALKDGRVGTCPLAKYRLPEDLRGRMLVSPSSVDADGLAILPSLTVIADRMAPWVSVHVVPRLLKKRVDGYDFQRSAGTYDIEGAAYTGAGGVAWAAGDLVIIQACSPVGNATILFHELMHVFWRKHLSDAAIEVLSASVADGAEWPGNYFSETEERVCRLFESWASARLEGAPAPEDVGDLTVGGLFEWIWQGGLADHQVVRDLVPGAAALADRRGLQMLPPPAPEQPPAPPPRAWADRLVDGILAAGAHFDGALDAIAQAGRRMVGRTAAAA